MAWPLTGLQLQQLPWQGIPLTEAPGRHTSATMPFTLAVRPRPEPSPYSLPSLAGTVGSKRPSTGHFEAGEVCLSFEIL